MITRGCEDKLCPEHLLGLGFPFSWECLCPEVRAEGEVKSVIERRHTMAGRLRLFARSPAVQGQRPLSAWSLPMAHRKCE